MLARRPRQAHLSLHRCNSSGQLPVRVAILRRPVLTSRCCADKNRALLRQAVSFAHVGTAVRSIHRRISPSRRALSAGWRDTPGLDEGSSDAASDTELIGCEGMTAAAPAWRAVVVVLCSTNVSPRLDAVWRFLVLRARHTGCGVLLARRCVPALPPPLREGRKGRAPGSWMARPLEGQAAVWKSRLDRSSWTGRSQTEGEGGRCRRSTS
jgi:hypothetical protein